MKSGLPEVCWLAELRKERGGSVFRLSVLRCSYQDVQARGASREAICKAVYMLYAADAGVMSKSADELARMMTVVVDVFREFGLTVSEKAETLNMRVKEKQPPPLLPPPLIIEAAGQRGTRRRSSFGTYLGSLVNEHGDLTREINYRSNTAWECFRRRMHAWEALRQVGSTVPAEDPPTQGGNNRSATVRLHDMVT